MPSVEQAAATPPNAAVAPAEILDLAFGRLKAGSAQQAESLVAGALRHAPTDPDALNLGGMIAQAMGEHGVAIERFDGALAQIGQHPAILHGRARSELALGDKERALTTLDAATGAGDAPVDVISLRASILFDLGRMDAAREAVAEGLARFPKQPHLLVLHGRLAAAAGQRKAAVESYRRAIAIEPRLRDAHRLAASELFAEKDYDGAAGHLARALALNDQDVAAWRHLSLALTKCDRPNQARGAARRALALAPDDIENRNAMAAALALRPSPEVDGALMDDLAIGLDGDCVETGALIAPLMNVLYRQAEYVRLRTALTERGWNGPLPLEEALPDDERAMLYQLTHPAFQKLFQRQPIPCFETERVLATLRAGFLALHKAGKLEDEAIAEPRCLTLLAMIASQAHAGEFVMEASAEEQAALAGLRARVTMAANLASAGYELGDWARLLLAAAYGPLNKIDGAGRLAPLAHNDATPEPARPVLKAQIIDPQVEDRFDAKIETALPAAEDAVTDRVRAQYEANPYPRWTRVALDRAEAGQRVADALGVPRAETGAPDAHRVLIAGCGTGAQAIRWAHRYPQAEVAAIDLSRRSLAYAARKAYEHSAQNIRFAQASLLALPEGPLFDEIHCAGVLHHLEDPEAGLRALLERLAPGGVMHLALYSRLARREIAAAREIYARATGPLPTGEISLEQIQAFRRWIAHAAPEELRLAMTSWNDFYSASMLRDLVFPAQETCYDVAGLKGLLERNGLTFLGFETSHDPAMEAAFDRSFPGCRKDLDAWAEFEPTRPSSFRAMYQFWVRKG